MLFEARIQGMIEHTGIQIQLQRPFQGVPATTLVAGFLEHAEDPIVAFDMIVGGVDILPLEEDDHLLEFVFGQFLQRPGEEFIGLVVGVIDHLGTPVADLLGGTSSPRPGKPGLRDLLKIHSRKQ